MPVSVLAIGVNASGLHLLTMTFIDLEFDTTGTRGAPLGDIASSLVSLDELLRDLGTMATYPSSVEFREIRVVAIVRNPLKVRLSLFGIPAEAVQAFQAISRDIILFRGRGSQLDPRQQANINTALDLVLHAHGKDGRVTDKEMQRLHGHILTLQTAEVPLKRVLVREE
jgi:hypothetical protein